MRGTEGVDPPELLVDACRREKGSHWGERYYNDTGFANLSHPGMALGALRLAENSAHGVAPPPKGLLASYCIVAGPELRFILGQHGPPHTAYSVAAVTGAPEGGALYSQVARLFDAHLGH